MIENVDIMGKSEQCLNTALTLNDLTGGHQLPDQDSSTRIIPLTRGYSTVVDKADYEALMQFKWHALTGNDSPVYAVRKCKKRTVFMHHHILPAPKGMIVDHIDGDSLNNRRCNLRLATIGINALNTKLRATNKSGIQGVRKLKSDKWIASLKGKCLGTFSDPQEARKAYVAAVTERYGPGYLRRPDSR